MALTTHLTIHKLYNFTEYKYIRPLNKVQSTDKCLRHLNELQS